MLKVELINEAITFDGYDASDNTREVARFESNEDPNWIRQVSTEMMDRFADSIEDFKKCQKDVEDILKTWK